MKGDHIWSKPRTPCLPVESLKVIVLASKNEEKIFHSLSSAGWGVGPRSYFTNTWSSPDIVRTLWGKKKSPNPLLLESPWYLVNGLDFEYQ